MKEKNMNITDAMTYIGVNDKTLDLFEGQYKIPNGISYNSSYIIQDNKIAVIDTADKRKEVSVYVRVKRNNKNIYKWG